MQKHFLLKLIKLNLVFLLIVFNFDYKSKRCSCSLGSEKTIRKTKEDFLWNFQDQYSIAQVWARDGTGQPEIFPEQAGFKFLRTKANFSEMKSQAYCCYGINPHAYKTCKTVTKLVLNLIIRWAKAAKVHLLENK